MAVMIIKAGATNLNLLCRHSRIKGVEIIANFQTQNLSPKSWMAEPTTGLISNPPSLRIIIVNNPSRMVSPMGKISRISKPELYWST